MCLQKENNCMQRIISLCSDILKVCSMIHLQGPAKGCRLHLYLPLTLEAPLDLLGYMVQAEGQLSQKSGPYTELSPGLGLTQNKQLFRSPDNWARVTYEEYVVSKIQRGELDVAPLFWL